MAAAAESGASTREAIAEATERTYGLVFARHGGALTTGGMPGPTDHTGPSLATALFWRR